MGLRQDVTSSARLVVSEELLLFGEMGLAVLAYAIWVGLTGAALSFGADAAGVSLSPTPWTGAKAAIVVVAAGTWVVVPAALATRLLVDRLTNESDNLSQHYRFRHPSALLLPPAALFVAVGVAVVTLDPAPWPLLAVFVAASTFVLVRTVTYGHRVFALSAPRVLQVIVFLAALVLAAALLTGGALAVGREAALAAVVARFGDVVGVDGLGFLVEGRVGVRVGVTGVHLPAVVAAAVAGTVGLPALYVLVQTVAASVARLRESDVPRAQLRTGQRHPEFARPTTDESQPVPSSPTASATSAVLDGGSTATQDDNGPGDATVSGDTPDGDGPLDTGDPSPGADDADEEALIDEVSHTRVYTPPADSEAEDETAETGGAAGFGGRDDPDEERSTEIVTDACPACEEPLEPDADYGFCPACGERL